MYINPEHMSQENCNRVARWMEANGCRHWIAMEPIIVRGSIAEYVAVERKGRPIRVRNDEMVPLGRKRLRLRVPLRDVA